MITPAQRRLADIFTDPMTDAQADLYPWVLTDDRQHIDAEILRAIWAAGPPSTELALMQLSRQYQAIYPEVDPVDAIVVEMVVDVVETMLHLHFAQGDGEAELLEALQAIRPESPPDTDCPMCRRRYAALAVVLAAITDDDGNVINPWAFDDDDGGQQKSREVLA